MTEYHSCSQRGGETETEGERESEQVQMRGRYVTQHFALVDCREHKRLLFRFVINLECSCHGA